MPIEDTLSEPDQAALRFCLKSLRQDPQITYKEVRREARNSAGIAVRRQIWTMARRELGLKVDDEGTDGASGGGADDAGGGRDPHFAPREERRHPPTAPIPPTPAPSTASTGHESPEPRHFPPPRREERSPPRFDSREEGDRRRPAWAQPSRQGPSARPFESREPFDRRPPSGAEGGAPPAADGAHSKLVSPPRNPIEFMVHYLQTVNRESSFLEIKDAAEREGYTIYPATFGRAQAIVGLVEAPQHLHRPSPPAPAPVAPPAAVVPAATAAPAAGSVTPAPAEAVPPVLGTRAPGSIDPISGLMIFMTALDDLDKDRLRFRNSIGGILSVVRHALDAAPQTPGLPTGAASSHPAVPASHLPATPALPAAPPSRSE